MSTVKDWTEAHLSLGGDADRYEHLVLDDQVWVAVDDVVNALVAWSSNERCEAVSSLSLLRALAIEETDRVVEVMHERVDAHRSSLEPTDGELAKFTPEQWDAYERGEVNDQPVTGELAELTPEQWDLFKRGGLCAVLQVSSRAEAGRLMREAG